MLTINPSLPRTPQRIVCLVPSLTEALFAFGLGGAIVGITDYCVEPQPQVRTKATIGGTKNPDVEAILRLAPDLVVANVEENRREDVEHLQGHGVPVFICFPCTVIEAITTLRTLAQITGVELQASPVLARIESTYEKTKALSMGRRKVRVFCPIWKFPWMTINRDTFIHDMIETCGGINVFAGRERRFPLAADLGQQAEWETTRGTGRDRRYPRISLNEVAGLMPEVILLPDEPYPFSDADRAEFVGFPSIPAVRDGRIHVIDGKIVCWYWSRLDESLRVLSGLLTSPNSSPPGPPARIHPPRG
jgi:ABC-type Fe3+-hydroxamate transport system substrate-binding protein